MSQARIGSVTPQSVVVVGAGFGGLACAKALSGHPEVQVTVIDQRNFHTFLPLLYQVATAGLNSADVAYPARGILRHQNLDFRQGEVVDIDWEHQAVLVRDVAEEVEGEQRIDFDHLVLAVGSRVRWFGVDGAAEHARPLYTLNDAVALRNHVLGRFEAAATDPSLIDDGMLTVVVVGGGPTGVETAGALAELFSHVLRKDFAHLDVARARVVLLEQGDALLAAFRTSSSAHALTGLEARGVEVRLGETVESVTATRVRLVGGDEIPAHTVVWAAGVQAAGLAQSASLATGTAGRVVVSDDLSLPAHPGGWAIGDVAHIPCPPSGSSGASDGGSAALPQLAPVAIQGGRHVAHMILRRLRGQPTRPFVYRDKGIMATIGRRAAVAELPSGLRLSGGPAWFAWLGLHLVTLLGMRNRLSVLVNWGWNYLTWDRGPRLIFGPDAG